MTPQEITRVRADIMLHFANGGEIEFSDNVKLAVVWVDCIAPIWNWNDLNYRKKLPPKQGSYIVVTKEVLDVLTKHPELKVQTPETPKKTVMKYPALCRNKFTLREAILADLFETEIEAIQAVSETGTHMFIRLLTDRGVGVEK